MGKRQVIIYRYLISLCLVTLIGLFAEEARAVDLLDEERKRPEADKARFEEMPKKVMYKEEPAKESAAIEEKMPVPAAEAEADADLEARKGRETRDRAIYESSYYRLRVKEILNNVAKRMRDASDKVEEQEAYEKVEPKISKLTALDQQAEDFMSKGEYEKAKAVYEEILTMSKDADLKEYIKKQKETLGDRL
jgi:tetratricopeptide (TPR) repeat protein